MRFNPEGVVPSASPSAATPSGLAWILMRPQGSGFAATLGSGPEPLRGSGCARSGGCAGQIIGQGPSARSPPFASASPPCPRTLLQRASGPFKACRRAGAREMAATAHRRAPGTLRAFRFPAIPGRVPFTMPLRNILILLFIVAVQATALFLLWSRVSGAVHTLVVAEGILAARRLQSARSRQQATRPCVSPASC